MRLGYDGGEVLLLRPKLAHALRYFSGRPPSEAIDEVDIARLLQLALEHLANGPRSTFPVYDVIAEIYRESREARRIS